jgi:uncharacterized metal-binding protein YceD (DUF177 family)
MIIDIARLDEDGEHLTGEDPSHILGLDPEDELLHPVAPVAWDIEAEILGTELLVRGTVRTQFGGVCCRCGGPLAIEIQDPEFCVSVEIDDETQEVDLTDEVRESILLALPSHPVCREDCKGLCPRCGQRLEQGDCGCEPFVSPAWEALAGLDIPPGDKES